MMTSVVLYLLTTANLINVCQQQNFEFKHESVSNYGSDTYYILGSYGYGNTENITIHVETVYTPVYKHGIKYSMIDRKILR